MKLGSVKAQGKALAVCLEHLPPGPWQNPGKGSDFRKLRVVPSKERAEEAGEGVAE